MCLVIFCKNTKSWHKHLFMMLRLYANISTDKLALFSAGHWQCFKSFLYIYILAWNFFLHHLCTFSPYIFSSLFFFFYCSFYTIFFCFSYLLCKYFDIKCMLYFGTIKIFPDHIFVWNLIQSFIIVVLFIIVLIVLFAIIFIQKKKKCPYVHMPGPVHCHYKS